MSIDVGTLSAEITLDDRGFKKKVRGAEDDIKGLTDTVDKETEEAAKKGGKNLGGLKTAAIAGGAVAGAALTASFMDSMNREASGDKLAASLGLSPDESKRAASLSADIFKNAWGESVQEVNAAMGSVMQNIDGMRNASDADLRDMTTGVLDLAKTFDQDLGATTRAVSQMMRTGLAKDGKEALDIITAGMQNGVNKSDDLLDTMNEYGTQFRKMGIDGKTAMGLMNQAIRGGARDSDKAADAIKELSIRAIDGSKTTIQGFKLLGVNAKQMQADFAAGGSRSAGALDMLLDKLREVKDPAERAKISVALLGTQSEDLGDALFNMDVSNAATGLGQVDGAAAKMSETLNSNASTSIEAMKRGIQDFGLKIVENTGTFGTFAAVAGGFLPTALQMGGSLAMMATSLFGVGTAATAAAPATTVAGAAAGGASAGFWSLAAALLANPITWIIAGIVALIAAIVYAWNNFDWFREGVLKVWEVIKSVFSGVLDVIKGVINWIKENWQTILPFLLGPVVGFAFMIIKHWDKIKDVVSRIKDWLVNAAKSIFNALTAPWRNGIALIIAAINALVGLWNGLSFSISTPDIPGTDWGGQDWSWESPDIPTITPPSFLQGLATGGDVTSSGAFLVGEHGPEIVNLKAGSAVTPNHALGSSNNTYNFNINSTDPDGVSREVYKVLKRIDRGIVAGAR